MREQARAEGWRISRFVVDATEEANICTNDVYPKNQHMHLKLRDGILEIQCKPVDGFSVSNFRMCPLTMQYVTKV